MLTAEEVRAIVREENLRLLRVLLEVQSHGSGHVSANVAVVALKALPDRFTNELLPLERIVIDYREGR